LQELVALVFGGLSGCADAQVDSDAYGGTHRSFPLFSVTRHLPVIVTYCYI
jgi:hypothetical protein